MFELVEGTHTVLSPEKVSFYKTMSIWYLIGYTIILFATIFILAKSNFSMRQKSTIVTFIFIYLPISCVLTMYYLYRQANQKNNI